MSTTKISRPFDTRTDATLQQLDTTGQYKHLHMLDSPMDAVVRMRQSDGAYRDTLCFCSNNYLGLANHPEVVQAGIDGLKKYGAGTASVRFICGTFEPHETLERTIAKYMGTESSYTFVSCWTATEAFFPTVSEAGDIIISDELNHACIIDAMRLTPVIKKGVHKAVFKHSDMGDARAKLQAAVQNPDVTGQIWVITDGVFSMEGDIAKLPELRALCDEFGAMLVVDDSHGHGVMGTTGRGIHEHYNMLPGVSGFDASRGAVDFFTGTLGKALGGGAGGFVAGSKRCTELLIQRGRPTLFSNALPVTVACSANKAIEILMNEPQRVQKLRDNVAYARKGIKSAGFDVLESPTAICPIIVGETATAISMSKKLLEMGVFVIGFGYPVVPEGEARLRVQISAAHTTEHLDELVGALRRL
ncbi:MAG: aminotransferase class I/II-fold pyridoxal phosphate-dependent enzyme [Phycisphaeraceae bacterium]|nr:aminotransferase class I/II-fold pyridoxal phosphate-dependent enzyme [Phycisphaerales bacterium]MCB9859197.1 aminotransferase class I/II-fold pyridoxal phosphate-dependent enzyme [Phycisphaeraceae bacterium]